MESKMKQAQRKFGKLLEQKQFRIGAAVAGGVVVLAAAAMLTGTDSGVMPVEHDGVNFTDRMGRGNSSGGDTPPMRTYVAKLKDPRRQGGATAMDSTRLTMSNEEDMPFDMSKAGVKGETKGMGWNKRDYEGVTLAQMESLEKSSKEDTSADVLSEADEDKDAPSADDRGSRTSREDILAQKEAERKALEESAKLKLDNKLAKLIRSFSGLSQGGGQGGFAKFESFGNRDGKKKNDALQNRPGSAAPAGESRRKTESKTQSPGGAAAGVQAQGTAYEKIQDTAPGLKGVQGAFSNAREAVQETRGEKTWSGMREEKKEKDAPPAAGGGAPAGGGGGGGGNDGAVAEAPTNPYAAADEGEPPPEKNQEQQPEQSAVKERTTYANNVIPAPIGEPLKTDVRLVSLQHRWSSGQACRVLYTDTHGPLCADRCPAGFQDMRTDQPYFGDRVCLLGMGTSFWTWTGDPLKPYVNFTADACEDGPAIQMGDARNKNFPHINCVRLGGIKPLVEKAIDQSEFKTVNKYDFKYQNCAPVEIECLNNQKILAKRIWDKAPQSCLYGAAEFVANVGYKCPANPDTGETQAAKGGGLEGWTPQIPGGGTSTQPSLKSENCGIMEWDCQDRWKASQLKPKMSCAYGDFIYQGYGSSPAWKCPEPPKSEDCGFLDFGCKEKWKQKQPVPNCGKYTAEYQGYGKSPAYICPKSDNCGVFDFACKERWKAKQSIPNCGKYEAEYQGYGASPAYACPKSDNCGWLEFDCKERWKAKQSVPKCQFGAAKYEGYGAKPAYTCPPPPKSDNCWFWEYDCKERWKAKQRVPSCSYGSPQYQGYGSSPAYTCPTPPKPPTQCSWWQFWC
ncbi:MAG: hypothetical protein ABIJ96_18605 [Elusimicrobiota bacterium]